MIFLRDITGFPPNINMSKTFHTIAYCVYWTFLPPLADLSPINTGLSVHWLVSKLFRDIFVLGNRLLLFFHDLHGV